MLLSRCSQVDWQGIFGGARRVLAVPIAIAMLFGGAPAIAGLTIVPTYLSSITGDPNAAAIEGVIQSAIQEYENVFADPITVNISFGEMSSGLGQSSFSLYSFNYASFLALLAADATTANDAVALAHIAGGPNNPVTGTSSIDIKSANLKAIGYTGLPPGSDGTISLNTHITDVGSPGTSGQYSLHAVAEHEIDEILGLGSTLGLGLSSPFNNQPSPEDFFRYDQNGNRSFTTNGSAQAYFSIDGTTQLAQFDNKNDGGDFGDWQSNPRPTGVQPKVQDAFATPHASPVLGVELTALDVIGYDLTNQSPVPEPAALSIWGLGVAIAALTVRQRRRKKVCERLLRCRPRASLDPQP